MKFSTNTTIVKYYGYPVPYGTDIGISQQKENILFPIEIDYKDISTDDFFMASNETIIHKKTNTEVAAWNRGQFQILSNNIRDLEFTKKELRVVCNTLIKQKRFLTLSFFYNLTDEQKQKLKG